MKNTKTFIIIISLLLTGCLFGQQQNFNSAVKSVDERLQAAMMELDDLRKQASQEIVPLNRELNELENELSSVRLEYQQVSRILDGRTLDMSNLTSKIKSQQEQVNYLSNLMGEYIRNFESRLHIAELQKYSPAVEEAKLAMENRTFSDIEIFHAQTEFLAQAMTHLDDALGGYSFKGRAADVNGTVKNGTFVMVGPSSYFVSDDGEVAGSVQQKLGSNEPAVVAYANILDTEAVINAVKNNKGIVPFDPTNGNAHVVEATKETLREHIAKGGPVMFPLLSLGFAAVLVALYKWVRIITIPRPSQKSFESLLEAIASQNKEQCQLIAAKMRGPVGTMIKNAVHHLEEPVELIEEVMFESVLATRLKLQSLLPFVSICAASAPLLGLLGTVTGIINTFKLITVFGSGDVKTLSGGISEALITTEYGLIVAIPSLLLHAFLSRKAKVMTDNMEQMAVAMVNQISKSTHKHAI